MISIIDYGMGNVGSLENMVRKVGGQCRLIENTFDILNADKLLLPGVGAFDNAMRRLADLGWIQPLTKMVVEERVPILCICLGMHLITKGSEEGALPGLGWISARTVRFHVDGGDLKVPHMGWNCVDQKKDSRLFNGMCDEMRFYFVHSYHLECADADDVLATASYGYEFASAVERGNVYATQFHPEKSHKFGMKFIQNFVEL